MPQSTRQRFVPSADLRPRTGHRSKRSRLGLVLSVGLVIALGFTGCTNEARMSAPLAQLGNPFNRPSESGFRAMVEASCGSKGVGETTVAELMGGDNAFNALTSALYRGDISNDEFMNQVLLAHPAPNANLPATGCIIDQLAQCFAEECRPRDSDAKDAEQALTNEATATAAMQAEALPSPDEAVTAAVELPSSKAPDEAPRQDAPMQAPERVAPEPLP